MKKWLLGLLPVLSLWACDNEWDGQQAVKEQRFPVQQERGIRGDIRNYIASAKFGGLQTRATNQYTLTPYVYEGDTVMYIANYGEGWDVFSNDYRAPMILFSSDTGSFDMDNMAPALKEYILSTADELLQLQQSDAVPDTTCGLWRTVVLRNEDVDPQRIQVSKRASAQGETRTSVHALVGENGYWQLLEHYISSSSTSITPKLTTTKWGQQYPWNVFIPYAENAPSVKGPAGCASVAVAQYLYYLHYATGVPTSTVTTATYNAATNKYTYSGASTSVWDLMAIDNTASTTATNYTATFIGHVGKSINTVYKQEKGSASLSNSIKFINSQAGTKYSFKDYDNAYVSQELGAGRPVLTYAADAENEGKHLFIIDRKRIDYFTTTSKYGWVGEDRTGSDTNEHDDDGNVIGYSYFYEAQNTSSYLFYYMNWGWSGSYDNVACSGDWYAGGYHFNDNRKIAR